MDDPDYEAEEYGEAAGDHSDSAQSSGFSLRGTPVENVYVSEGAADSEHRGQPLLLKRAADTAITPRPFKRQRSKLNLSYLDLLNQDIDDIARRAFLNDPKTLAASQVGLTRWSSSEKHSFFEALARLGKHDLASISAAVGTKSVVEVSQYISLLREARDHRHDSNVERSAHVLQPYEYPAAVEISQQCIRAQEEAADEINIRQEARDEQGEQKRWGAIWDVTDTVAARLDWAALYASREGKPLPPAFARLFHTSRWLELSRLLFMNSSIPSSNWHFIEPSPPSIWATAFEDFHSLAVSITRRLVQTTLFMAMSRARMRKNVNGTRRNTVKLQDVEAAVSSLGMASTLDESWIDCPRRLRLHVYQNPPEMNEDGKDDDVDEEEPMSYDEIRDELRGASVPVSTAASPGTAMVVTEESSPESDAEHDSDQFSDRSSSPSPGTNEDREINQEADELFVHAATGIRQDKAAKRAFRLRIAAERQKERFANDWDEHASYKAELELWDILQKKPPLQLPKRPEPKKTKRSTLDVEGMHSAGRDWMQKLEYFSEWETVPEPQQEEGEEADDESDYC